MKIDLIDLNLPLEHRFSISRGSTDEVQTIFVRVSDQGIEGWGEAAAVKYKGQSRGSMRKSLELASHRLESMTPVELIEEWEDFVIPHLGSSGAMAGLNMAIWDWKSKREGISLKELWGSKEELTPVTSFTIGIDTPEVMAKKVVEAQRYPVLKVKLGFKGDVEVFEMLQAVGPQHQWRVDVNGGWTLEEALLKSKKLEAMGVEMIEQPMQFSNPEDLKKIQGSLSIPIYLDESVDGIQDLERYQGVVGGVNLKLTKIGSLSGLRQAIFRAKELGFQVMLGCMTCSSLHISGIIPLASFADALDLDGSLLLKRDPFSGLKLTHQGRFRVNAGVGCGLEFDSRKLESL